ncbi:guanylate kinase [Allisonella histaminiformans]|uniref:guanylate kinase n=1 Tax=Allisonella histaminiformans TaxID=209880 RepID=UPI002E7996D1|nr:guanylate kinase [Allisonella histaminiformans]
MNTTKKDKGILLVVSGPSGAGKGTICAAIRKVFPKLNYSISMTTRAPRKGEVEGTSYFFRTNEEFEKLIKEDAFLEYARVYDHYYGTPKKYALDKIENGESVLLEIDIQGAMQVKQRYPQGVFVYVVPPSLDVLSARIHGRGTDSEEVIQKRLAKITDELAMAHKYDYIIVNDVLEDAVHKVCSILEAESCKLSRNEGQVEVIFNPYINKEVGSK